MQLWTLLSRLTRPAAAVATFTLVASAGLSAKATGRENADILGTWKLTKVLDSAEITSTDDRGAADLIGKTLEVRTDGVLIAGEPCRAPDFKRHREPAPEYVRENYHAPIGRLGLPDPVTVVHLRCTEAFIKAPKKIVVFWSGYFYDAVKQPTAKH